jgi:hypothetical protein
MHALRERAAGIYRRAMNQFSESVLQDRGEGPGFLARAAIALIVVIAGVGFSLLIAAA